MALSHKEIEALAAKLIDGSITASEQERFNAWVDEQMVKETFEVDAAFARDAGQLKERMLIHVLEAIDAKPQRKINTRRMNWLPYAAAVIFALAVGIFFLDRGANKEQGLAQAADIASGGNKATLTLADGRTIDLSEGQSGIVVGDGITYGDGSAVLSPETGGRRPKTGQDENQLPMADFSRLTLTTPKGGTYQITLSDGTKVWLNAASTLKYPSRFTGNERVVELDGEGYFSVMKDERRPFRVKSDGQEVKVLGTEFNISAYPDENETKTTLVEGSVQVVLTTGHRPPTTIKPSQQSKLENGNISVDDVDIDPYVAWKSGMFHFKHTPLADMMYQIERWYDVDVIYKSRIPQETFSGRMRRNVSLLTVLDLLKASEISFYIEGNKLIIE
ncbi:FecR family protein [Parapedobacter tibetensis]|uniref:FecR family protein n=1 Tax=Parapedobacter tibetensis TaxID=2972951 RepID=UPI00214DE1D7|nr:FecR family protein [Parapedobacter tibetensis]